MARAQKQTKEAKLFSGANILLFLAVFFLTAALMLNSNRSGLAIMLEGVSTYEVIDEGVPQGVYLTKTGNGSGSVSSSPKGISCGTDCDETYAFGTSVTLTANSSTGSQFGGWSGSCTGTGRCRLTVDGVKNVSAAFTLRKYTLTTKKYGNGTITSSIQGINCGTDCKESYDYNTMVVLTATPDFGHSFAGWGGACKGTGTCGMKMTSSRSASGFFK